MIGFIESYENQVDASFSLVFSDLLCNNYINLFLSLTSRIVVERVEIATKFFKKDSKIINCLWKVNENRTFFHKFLEISTKAEKVAAMKTVVDDNFNSEVAQKIFVGKYQSANFLSLLWHNRWIVDDTNAVADAVNYYFDIKILQNISSFEDFMEFMLNQNFSAEEIREFFFTNINIFQEENGNEKIYEKYAKKLLSPDDFKQIVFSKHERYFIDFNAM